MSSRARSTSDLLVALRPDVDLPSVRTLHETPYGRLAIRFEDDTRASVSHAGPEHAYEAHESRYEYLSLVCTRQTDGHWAPTEDSDFGRRSRRPRVQPPLDVRTAIMDVVQTLLEQIAREQPLIPAYARFSAKHMVAARQHRTVRDLEHQLEILQTERKTLESGGLGYVRAADDAKQRTAPVPIDTSLGPMTAQMIGPRHLEISGQDLILGRTSYLRAGWELVQNEDGRWRIASCNLRRYGKVTKQNFAMMHKVGDAEILAWANERAAALAPDRAVQQAARLEEVIGAIRETRQQLRVAQAEAALPVTLTREEIQAACIHGSAAVKEAAMQYLGEAELVPVAAPMPRADASSAPEPMPVPLAPVLEASGQWRVL